MQSHFIVLSSLVLLAGAAAAQPAELVRDLETSAVNASSLPGQITVVQDRAYFTAIDPLRGRELWTTDGTRQGTRLVRDLSPGSRSSASVVASLDPLEPGGDVLWLTLDDGASGRELWVSDGTAAGTRLVKDLCPGACGYLFQGGLFSWRGQVLFSPHDPELGLELWISDGTRDGTRLVKDVCPGECNAFPEVVARLGDVVLFAAEDGEHSRELWRTDGTEAGTALVEDICPGACFSIYPSPVAVLGGEAFFAANDNAHGVELWKSDGTAAGTELVKDLCSGFCSGDARSFVVGGELLVVAGDGTEIWKSDGTSAGTVRIAALPPSVYVRSDLIPVRAKAEAFFFTRYLGQFAGQLWRTDGTPAGTRPIADFEDFDTRPALVGDRLIFAAGGEQRFEPWVSDGTPEGTHLLRELRPGEPGSSPRSFTAFGPSRVLFTAETGRGIEPWVTDGTAAGTRLLKDISRPDSSSHPTSLTAFGGRLFFVAAAADEGGGLWTSDGTEAGTTPVAPGLRVEEIVPGTDHLYFTARDAEGVSEPWVSDGTPAGTLRLADLAPGPVLRDSGSRDPAALGGRLFFAEGPPGQRLWTSDGTPEGTRVVKDVYPEWGGGACLICITCCADLPDYPHTLTPAGDRLFFVGFDEEHGTELWTSDGTEAGTARVVDLVPGAGWSDPAELTAVGPHLYFTAAKEKPLWRTDGTAAGTVAVSGVGRAEPRELTALGDRLYFIGARSSGDSLYVCEPACDRATRVRKLKSRGAPGFARQLTAADQRLFFTVFTEATGDELWTSDGTAAGTRLVVEIVPGSRGSYPQSLAAVDGRLVFAADDGVKGLELWMSDGTAEGTCRVQNVARGPRPSSPADFAAVGDRVFFAADDGVAGRELWALPRRDYCGR